MATMMKPMARLFFVISMLQLVHHHQVSAQSGLAACGPGFDHFPFCNTSLSIDDRVNDLVSRINDTIKPALLTARGPTRYAQQSIPELGVPSYYWGQNCIHSSMFSSCTSKGKCSTSFPSGPSWAAMFDKTLMQQMAVVIGQETRAGFNLQTWKDNGGEGSGLECWGPVININRDPRWGRNSEGGAEDPTLMAALAVAWTKGLQEGDGKESKYIQVAVTLKHFDANTLEGGANGEGSTTRHNVDVNLTKYLLADYYWPAYKHAIRDANAKGVMCSYNAINGVPTCLDPLMKAAREAWNFTGYVTSDSDAVADAWAQHKYVPTNGDASCKAIKDGGCDIDSGNTYSDSLLAAVAAGKCSMADVDKSLFNTMRVRFELGLFDKKIGPYWKLGESDIGTNAAKEMNFEAALKSFVLISNPKAKNVLPFKVGSNVVVIGPHGNASTDLIQVDTGMICDEPGQKPAHFTYGCVKSTLQAITELNIGGTTTFSPGCDLYSNDTSGFAAAIAAANKADVIVLGLGISERPPKNEYVESEGHDRSIIDLPETQKKLLSAMIALGKPIVLFYLNGGSVAITEESLNAPNVAIIEAFYPGMEGARALASAIFGASNRWGRMPYTVYPADWVNTNSMFDHDVTHKRTYRYGANATIPFGFGLSLTHFKLSQEGGATATSILKTDGSSKDLMFKIEVENVGDMAGDEVVQAYIIPKTVDLPLHPIKTMIDFVRIDDIAAGGSEQAVFAVNTRNFLLATTSGDMVAAPGQYTLSFEDGSGQIVQTQVELTGSQVVVEPFPTVKN